MGGARARQPDDDDRRFELDLEGLGVPRDVVLVPQPGLQQADEPFPDDESPEPRQPGVALDCGDLRREPVEQSRVTEVVQAGRAASLGDDVLRVEVDLHLERVLVEGLLLGGALRLAQVLDPHLVGHRVSWFRALVLLDLGPMPPSSRPLRRSVWPRLPPASATESPEAHRTLAAMPTADVLVIGGGLLGSSVAYELARSGARVVLADNDAPGRASDAGAGICSPQTWRDPDDAWWRFAENAAAHLEELIGRLADSGADPGPDAFARCGSLVVALAEHEDQWFTDASDHHPWAHARDRGDLARRRPGDVPPAPRRVAGPLQPAGRVGWTDAG